MTTPSHPVRGGSFFARYRDRMVLAVACSIAVHEVALGMIHPPARPTDREQPARALTIAIETPRPTPRPTPTPKPTPPPTPPPRVTPPPHFTPAPVPQVAAAQRGRPSVHHGGGARRATTHKATVHAPLAVAGTGSGTSSGTGSGTTAGAGGGAGGQGAGEGGNGNAAVNAETPCGIVEFIPYDSPKYRSGTAYEPIQATVTFRNGERRTARFPYPWVYPNGEQNDPWSNTNLPNKDFPVTLQRPPPGVDVSDPILQYIIAHSDARGYTDLPDCPRH